MKKKIQVGEESETIGVVSRAGEDTGTKIETTMRGVALSLTYVAKHGVGVQMDAAGVERHIHVRSMQISKASLDSTTEVHIEARSGPGVGMQTLRATVGWDLPNAQRQGAAGNLGEVSVRSPLTGRVVKCIGKVGDAIAIGSSILIIEAMKMENHVKATSAGTLSAIKVKAGDAVQAGAELARIKRD